MCILHTKYYIRMVEEHCIRASREITLIKNIAALQRIPAIDNVTALQKKTITLQHCRNTSTELQKIPAITDITVLHEIPAINNITALQKMPSIDDITTLH